MQRTSGVLGGAMLAAAAAMGTVAGAAESLDVKTGAWEMTTVAVATGQKLPAEALEGLPAAQRAEMERQLKAQEGKPMTHTSRECLTRKDLDEAQIFKEDEDEGVTCTVKVVSRSSRRIVAEKTCPAPAASKARLAVEAQGRERISATMELERADGARVKAEMKGRWLGASCEGIPKEE